MDEFIGRSKEMANTIPKSFKILFLIVICIPGGYGVVGGDSVNITSIPHQVGILVSNELHCGGGIIGETHILTAAHCVLEEDNIFYSDIKITSGSDDLYDRITTQKHYVSIIICHPEYNRNVWGKNDIAVVKLTAPIFFSPYQKPISFQYSRIPVDAIVQVTGWGMRGGGIRDRYLQSLRMYIIDLFVCSVMLRRRLHVNTFCAMEDNIDRGIGFGDSGSLVIYNGKAVGITFGGAQPFLGNPGIFTHIHPYIPWIKEAVERY